MAVNEALDLLTMAMQVRMLVCEAQRSAWHILKFAWRSMPQERLQTLSGEHELCEESTPNMKHIRPL